MITVYILLGLLVFVWLALLVEAVHYYKKVFGSRKNKNTKKKKEE